MYKALCLVFCLSLAACDAGDVATPNANDSASGTTVVDATPVSNSGMGTVVSEGSNFDIMLDAASLSIEEGGSAQFSISMQRDDNDVSPIELQMTVDSSATETPVVATLSNAVMTSSGSPVVATVSLPVARNPIQAREDRIVVIASDGVSEVQATVTVAVSPIDAPDIYLLIGQSNMEGSSLEDAKQAGPGEADEPNEHIQQLNVLQNEPSLWTDSDFTNEASNVVEPRFITAEDPLHQPLHADSENKSGTQIGMGLSFAKAALANTTNDIILVPAAWSSTSFCAGEDPDLSWNAEPSSNPAIGGTQLADRALTRLNMTLRDTGGVWRGMIWHQGESDSENAVCAALYRDNLVALVNRLRTDAFVDARGEAARGANADVPFVLGTMSQGEDERGDFSILSDTKVIVDGVHRNIASELAWSDVVNADDLVPPAWPCGQGSCVHFGAASYRELGVRFYSALSGLTR